MALLCLLTLLLCNRWHVSRIVEVDAQGQRALVHFNGWNPKFDTWISFENLKEETKKELAPTPAPVRVAVAYVDEDHAELSVVAGEGAAKGDGSKELQQYQFKVNGDVRPVQRFAPPRPSLEQVPPGLGSNGGWSRCCCAEGRQGVT